MYSQEVAGPVEILRRGVEEGLHPGAQIYVEAEGRTVLDFACGEAGDGVAMGTDSLTQWYSCGKPLTAVLIAQLYERGELQLGDRVTRFVPEFGAGGKEAITIFQLLTHTAGFRGADDLPRDLEWDEAIARICAAAKEANWTPGAKAGYSTQASWFILAEIIQRITGAKFDELIKSELLDRLGMKDCWLGLPVSRHEEYGERIAVMYNTAGGKRDVLPLQNAEGMALCRPGASARGPIRQFARFYRMLLNGGELEGHKFLRPETVALFTSRQRIGMYDHTFMHTLDFGLGFILNSNRYGAETVPYGYGRRASEEAFGHSGAQSSCAFADPKYGLIAAWVTNGMCGERQHQKRQRELNTSIYEQVGLG